jgi:hypothetical protein
MAPSPHKRVRRGRRAGTALTLRRDARAESVAAKERADAVDFGAPGSIGRAPWQYGAERLADGREGAVRIAARIGLAPAVAGAVYGVKASGAVNGQTTGRLNAEGRTLDVLTFESQRVAQERELGANRPDPETLTPAPYVTPATRETGRRIM